MTNNPPHIPPDEHVSLTPSRGPATMYFIAMLLIGAMSGFVASILYAAYGPTPAQKFETRIEQSPVGIDEHVIMNAQQSVATVVSVDTPLYATAITSDGWFIADARAAHAKKILVRGQGTLPVVKTIVDSATGLAFLKTQAQNLQVMDDEALSGIARGSQIFVVLPTTAIPVTLQDGALCITDACPFEYADQLSYAGVAVESVALHAADGAAVITSRGTLLGFATTQNNRLVIVPVDEMKSLFQTVFTSNMITRATLEIRVQNTLRVPAADQLATAPAGFVVQVLHTAHPAYDLKDGDIITAVAGEPVQADTTLFSLIQNAVGQKTVQMTVTRAGKSVDVTLPITFKNSHA